MRKVKKLLVDSSDTEADHSKEGVGRIKVEDRQASDRPDGKGIHTGMVMVICAIDHVLKSAKVNITPVIDT